MTAAKDYMTTPDLLFKYPGAGDDLPPGGAKVLLLTEGGVCITGAWQSNRGYIGWSPMPKRDKQKEAFLQEV